MNSETQILVKMSYIESASKVLLRCSETHEAVSTLEWLQERAKEIIESILGPREKRIASWARVADRCLEHVRTLRSDLPDVKPDSVTVGEEIIHTISVLTHMLEDLSLVRNKAELYDIDSMLTAAYTLEKVMQLPKQNATKEDEIRAISQAYLDKFYKKMSEV